MDFDKINIDAVSYNVKDSTARQQIEAEISAREQADTQLEESITQLTGDVSLLQKTVVKNVIDYGADNTGVSDSLPAFVDAANAATAGGYVFVPDGVYNLSAAAPKNVQYLIATGARFTGNGVGSPQSGAGLFPCTAVSNPWLVTSGPYYNFDISGVPCPAGGAVNAMSAELKDQQESGRYWRNLIYLGAATGTAANPDQHTELINLVENITGHKAIMMELDLNAYQNTGDFSVAFLITGGGNVETDMTAIDIQRDATAPNWTNAISVTKSNTAIYVDNNTVATGFQFGEVHRKATPGIAVQQKTNGADGIVIRRHTDSSPDGNLIVCWSDDEQTELFAVGASGDIRAQSLTLKTGVSYGLQRITVETTSFNQGENTMDVAAYLNGKQILAVVEPSTIGFVSNITSISVSGNNVNYYLESEGSGTVRFTIIAM